LRVLEHVHGHLGWLAVAALAHPALILRKPRRRAPLAAVASTSVALAAGLLGVLVYPDYRARLKQSIFIHTPAMGWNFERKEHLAVFALGFALVGCIAHLASSALAEETVRVLFSRAAHSAYVAAFVFALAAAVLGVAVATTRTF
jgi:hypothetical protein